MHSAASSIGLDLSAPARALKRLAPAAALVLVFALAIGFQRSQETQAALSRMLSTAVRHGVAEGGLIPIAGAGLALTLWLLWLIARQLAFFAIFMLVELLLLGPPRRWRTAAFALTVQVAFGLLYFLLAPVYDRLLPLQVSWQPWIVIDASRLAIVLGPVSEMVLALAALLAFDFVGYWLHRAQHAIPLLWRFHAVHHSIEDLDALNSYVHPVDLFAWRAAMMGLSAVIGFRFGTVMWMLAFQALHDRLLHTRAPINFGPLGLLLVDNRYHFLHHTVDRARADKNFAGSFTVFDRLFGTYCRPGNALGATGLDEKLPPRTLVRLFLAKLDGRT